MTRPVARENLTAQSGLRGGGKGRREGGYRVNGPRHQKLRTPGDKGREDEGGKERRRREGGREVPGDDALIVLVFDGGVLRDLAL